jgi:hypothetical protein
MYGVVPKGRQIFFLTRFIIVSRTEFIIVLTEKKSDVFVLFQINKKFIFKGNLDAILLIGEHSYIVYYKQF